MILQVEFELDPAELSVTFSDEELALDVEFDAGSDFKVDFGEIQKIVSADVPVYEGEYEVIPTPEGQTLETAGKLMESDTTVKAIPVYEVSNAAGGTTVYIANEV